MTCLSYAWTQTPLALLVRPEQQSERREGAQVVELELTVPFLLAFLQNERCQRLNWERAIVDTRTNADGKTFTPAIRLSRHVKKSQNSPIEEVRFQPHPPLECVTTLEARHMGAVYALFRVSSIRCCPDERGGGAVKREQGGKQPSSSPLSPPSLPVPSSAPTNPYPSLSHLTFDPIGQLSSLTRPQPLPIAPGSSPTTPSPRRRPSSSARTSASRTPPEGKVSQQETTRQVVQHPRRPEEEEEVVVEE